MNRTVKLYRSVKRPSGVWGTNPIPDKQLKNLKDLPKDEGNYYLGYYNGKHRQMPSVGRFADAAKQRLVQKRKELGAKAIGVELPQVEPQNLIEPSITNLVAAYLEQQAAFVGMSKDRGATALDVFPQFRSSGVQCPDRSWRPLRRSPLFSFSRSPSLAAFIY
jgi:hypothetical protein